jgi:hypothetical protein
MQQPLGQDVRYRPYAGSMPEGWVRSGKLTTRSMVEIAGMFAIVAIVHGIAL